MKTATLFLTCTAGLLLGSTPEAGFFHPYILVEENHLADDSEIAINEAHYDVSPKKPKKYGNFSAVLDPREKTSLYAEISSPVKWVAKQNGDRFMKGETLLLLDDVVFQSDWQKAKIYFSKAQKDLSGLEQLYADGLASEIELGEARANFAKADADLVMAQKNIDSTIIRAPYNGKVIQVATKQYELPQKGKELIRIIEDEVLIVRTLIDSDSLSFLAMGLPLEIRVNETGERYTAVVSRIGGMIDPASSTLEIEAELENPCGKLRAGMTGVAHFILSENNKGL